MGSLLTSSISCELLSLLRLLFAPIICEVRSLVTEPLDGLFLSAVGTLNMNSLSLYGCDSCIFLSPCLFPCLTQIAIILDSLVADLCLVP